MERTVVVVAVVGNPLNYARLARRSEGLKWSPSAEDHPGHSVSRAGIIIIMSRFSFTSNYYEWEYRASSLQIWARPDQTRPDQDIPGQTIGICVYVTAPLSTLTMMMMMMMRTTIHLGRFRGSGHIVQCGSEVEKS